MTPGCSLHAWTKKLLRGMGEEKQTSSKGTHEGRIHYISRYAAVNWPVAQGNIILVQAASLGIVFAGRGSLYDLMKFPLALLNIQLAQLKCHLPRARGLLLRL